MPTVSVDQEFLFLGLGRRYDIDEFQTLCFEFGIELEEATSELKMAMAQLGADAAKSMKLSDRPLFKIDIPANRSDLLCAEGILTALRVFLGQCSPPKFILAQPPVGKTRERIFVSKGTQIIRPIILAAVVRGINFTPESYKSFIETQDKLHNNICRKRALASMGTHDLDKMEGPFYYDASEPKTIKFVALGENLEMDAKDLIIHYKKNVKHLAKYVHLIETSSVFPVIRDSKERVCSLPPLINSEFSKITLETKNILIECTATDYTRAEIALNNILAMITYYTSYTAEAVEIINSDGKVQLTPSIDSRIFKTSEKYISSILGVKLESEEVILLLRKAGFRAKIDKNDKKINVLVPITRADVLHECDLAEDVGIAYGYLKLPSILPKIDTIGRPLLINQLSDGIRTELAFVGWTEIMSLILCSIDEAFKNLRRIDDEKTVVKLSNPRTKEYQIIRPSLIIGILKTIRENKSLSLPMKLFELGDITIIDETMPRRSINERRFCLAYASMNSGFEIVHGVIDHIIKKIDIESKGCKLIESNSNTFLSKRGCDIIYKNENIGNIGVLHPEVLISFEIPFTVTIAEIKIKNFL